MWMKHDQDKGNATRRPNEEGLLRCPMCKGRGYFEPTQVTTAKNSDYFSCEAEARSNTPIKLPLLQIKSETKQRLKPRFKYSLPSITSEKNYPEHRVANDSEPQYEDIGKLDLGRKGRQSGENYGNVMPHKPESRIRTGMSQKLSVASSNDSNLEKHLIPTPRTPINPMETLKSCLSKLKTHDWNESLNALKEIIQLSRYQPKLLDPNMVVVYRGLIFLLKSFRSTVVRTACQACNELFASMANTQRPEFDELVKLLLQKTADKNKSVRQDANEALDTMIINVPANHSVRTIIEKGASHKSPMVRGATARLLVCIVGVVGIDAVYNGNKESRGKIINSAAVFMQDGCQEVRNFGRRLMKLLMRHDDFDDVLQAEVNEVLLKRIEKTLITLKYKTQQ